MISPNPDIYEKHNVLKQLKAEKRCCKGVDHGKVSEVLIDLVIIM